MRVTTSVSRGRGPRLYHKKSRAGCVRCKQRRVKCNEARPSCGGCSRHAVDCVYPTEAAGGTTLAHSSAESRATSDTETTEYLPVDLDSNHRANPLPSKLDSPSAGKSVYQVSNQELPKILTPDCLGDSELDLPESRERRLWELRLLHNSLTEAKPFSTPQPPQVMNLWAVEVPNMALKEGKDAILYGIMAHSALNMWTRSTDHQERETLIRLQHTYLSMMLRQQRCDVAELNPANADSVCLSSLKILTHALALIQTLPLEPWEPPVDWLQMGNGAGAVFRNAWSMVNKEGTTKLITFIRSPPVLDDPNETILSDHSDLLWILETPPGPQANQDTELDNLATKAVYEKALAYTCSVQRALERREPEFAICRRLGGFAVWIPCEFTQFLVQRRPRAMVILAHFMSLFLEMEHIWMIGKAGERQIRGIHKNLPMEWCYKLDGLFQKFKKPEQSPRPFGGGHGVLM
ncbi:hypothetical protein JX265_003914 [Neoarthrinium moseri]|uniref:Zn(2)-C6 fungal-type domain-containing protein n=1 Tax=Neoarthrinium moseri TaxID=1658444 RepID=A0A9P9WRC0_9PEZI|nr:uncharacterized protein JN550_009478 [Neoarthrinium moseri]KAI1863778.1 hypothetical protein JN550_009478 [Neoarthrinium moseri]KAI1876388.1 hypothetical protein JX265_003914 [Neoarthrinium moseri]